MSKSLIPQSKAKTAYGLLSEVRRAILDEPKRYNQEFFISRKSEGNDGDDAFPTCGTIGCVAGWIATLTSRKLMSEAEVEHRAVRLLGDDVPHETLFRGDAIQESVGRPGTPRYARAGADHILKFQKKWEKELRAQRVGRRTA